MEGIWDTRTLLTLIEAKEGSSKRRSWREAQSESSGGMEERLEVGAVTTVESSTAGSLGKAEGNSRVGGSVAPPACAGASCEREGLC